MTPHRSAPKKDRLGKLLREICRDLTARQRRDLLSLIAGQSKPSLAETRN